MKGLEKTHFGGNHHIIIIQNGDRPVFNCHCPKCGTNILGEMLKATENITNSQKQCASPPKEDNSE